MSSTPSTNSVPRKRRYNKPGAPPLWLIYLLLAAPVLFLLVFRYVPAVSALWHAFTRWDLGGDSTFVGFANYVELARDGVFLKSLGNLCKLGLFAFSVSLTVPFIVAEMIFHLKTERWSFLCRVLLVLPMMVPGVVVFMLWRYIYSDAGPLTELLTTLGLHSWVYGWLSHPKTALLAIAFVGFPFAHGIHTLIYYAGLANIPASVLEAAELDGLGAIGRIFRIHIPLILQQAKLLMVITIIGIVNGFESVYILTQDGGPYNETMVPGLYMYLNGFSFGRMGYACAIGLLMLLFLLCFTIGLNRLVRSETHDPTAR